jgi:hypothetical protein
VQCYNILINHINCPQKFSAVIYSSSSWAAENATRLSRNEAPYVSDLTVPQVTNLPDAIYFVELFRVSLTRLDGRPEGAGSLRPERLFYSGMYPIFAHFL